MLRRPTRPRSSKADNWGNDRCFGVAVINESVVGGDLCKRTRNRAGDRVTGRPNPTSVKSSEGRDYLYRTQIEELQTSVMGKRALPNILTKALAASKSQDPSPLKDSTYPSGQTPGKPYCRVKNQPLALNRSQRSEAQAVLLTPKPLRCMASKKL